MSECKNCNASTTDRFCAACGQKTSTQRISWHWLLHEVIDSVLVVDRGLFFTLKELFTRPGHTIREFLEGKRKVHFKPLGLLVLTATVYSLLARWFTPDLTSILEGPEQVAVAEKMNHWISNYYALMELALIPLFGSCSWLVMRNYGHNIVEHMVIQSFLAVQRIVVGIVFLPLNLISIETAMFGSMLLSTLYLAGYIVSMVQLYNERSAAWVLVRSVVALGLSFVLLTVLAGVGGYVAKGLGWF